MRQLNDNGNNTNQIDEAPSKRNTQRGPHCHATPRLELIKGSRASLTVTDVTEERIKKGAVSSWVIVFVYLVLYYANVCKRKLPLLDSCGCIFSDNEMSIQFYVNTICTIVQRVPFKPV